jgi:N-acetylneuraminic acid mutarotase
MPTPRLEPGVTAAGTRLVVAGGFITNVVNGSMVTAAVDVFDPLAGKTGAWLQPSPFPDVPVLRHHIQLATVGTTLYFLGGLDATPDGNNNYPARGDCFSLDTATPGAQWQPLPIIPIGAERGSAAVVVVPPRIYLIGGAATTAAIADVIYFDTQQNAWCPNTSSQVTCDAIPALPEPLSHPAATRRLDGAFVTVGGLTTLFPDSAVDHVWVLTVGATGWQAGAAMPPHGAGLSSARGGCAYGVLEGHLACAGGEGGQAAFDLVQGYDPIGNCWVAMDPLPAPRAGTQGAAIGQRLFVPGGSLTLPPIYEPTDSLFVYAPPIVPACP